MSEAYKLSEQDVVKMRRRYRDGESVSDIAKDYPVREQSVGFAVRGETWPDVTVEPPCETTRGFSPGETHAGSTLDEETVIEMRRQHRYGSTTIAELADKHGVSYSAVYNAVRGRNWSCVDDREPPVPPEG